MSIKIIKIEEKPLLSRKEVTAKLTFVNKATTSNDETRKAIASELKTDDKLVVVKHIYTLFGSSEADVEAYVYSTEEDMKMFEPKIKKKEEQKGEEGAEEAKPAEEKKEESPAEEKKEEAKPAEEKAG